MACASFTRCRMPLLYAPMRLPAASTRSTASSARIAAARASSGVTPLSLASAVTHSRPVIRS